MMPESKGWNLGVPGVTVIVALIMGGLYTLDQFLAKLERDELRASAQDRYAEGRALLAQGRAADAIPAFQRAHTLDRTNREYELALAEADLADRQFGSAQAVVTELLQRDSNDARANLIMARILSAEERFGEADSYYHRAIYGAWPANSPQRRLETRMELIQALARRGERQELLSELLPLQSEIQNDPAMMLQVARLFVVAGSPGRAADTYRAVIAKSPDDIAAYSGLAEAELAGGDYRAARSALVNALRRKPGDPELLKRAGLASRLLGLDPTPRRLGSYEKFRRSTEILGMVQAALDQCAAAKAQSPALEAALDSADTLLSKKAKGPVTNEQSEERLSLAEQLWKTRQEFCGSAPLDSGDLIPFLMAKLAQ